MASATTAAIVGEDAQFSGRFSGHDLDVLGRLDQGKVIPGIDYIEAQRMRRRIGRQFARLFDHVDCIFTPTTPITAPKSGEVTVEVGGAKEEVRAAATRFTRGMNALGLPAISIPCGFTRGGLPIGLQIIAAAGQEDLLLHVAAATEDALGLTDRTPIVD